MKLHSLSFVTLLLLLALTGASATTFYVDANSTNPTPPFADWNTAAADIQSAIDVSSNGDLVLVTNGVYQTGGRVVYGSLTNRVVVDKAVTVQSVNGPEVTTIQGYKLPVIFFGASAVRCVYLAASATLDGFTLADGATSNGADAIKERSGGGIWSESTNSLVTNCIVTGNICEWNGAGVYSGTLIDCQIINNTNKGGSGHGGGAAFSTLLNSTISSNYCLTTGGGALSCTLNNCLVIGNSMGGVDSCVLDDCIIKNNYNLTKIISSGGGGALLSTLNHCLIFDNQAQGDGGGAYQSELNFCIVSNNVAGGRGGGVYAVPNATNRCGVGSQIIGNSSTYEGGGVNVSGSGNIVLSNWNFNGWSFISNSVVQDGGGMAHSPALVNCVFMGNSAGRDGGGLFSSGGVTNCTFTGNTAVRNGGAAYSATLENCLVQGNQAGGNGGGIYGLANNCVINSNAATLNGGGIYSYSLILTSWAMNNCALTNNSAANGGGGFSSSGNLISNYVFYANTAITNGGGAYGANLKNCRLISNQARLGGGGYDGTYFNCQFMGNTATDSGGGICSPHSPPLMATNCLFANNQAAINGGGVYGGFNQTLDHCSFSGNSAGLNGGGAYNLNLTSCFISGNSAANGGGAYGASLLTACYISNNSALTNGGGTCNPIGNSTTANCLFTGNVAATGGGAYGGYNFNNSTFVGNTATIAGGGIYVQNAPIFNSIFYDNTAPNGVNYSNTGNFSFCCASPLPKGNFNLTNDPSFVSLNLGNFRLQTNSPCINAGTGINPKSTDVDLDGRPRMVGGKIDIGAYEFQGPGMGEFIGWLQQYGLPTDGSADTVDSDGDHLNNQQEWIAGTNPTNAASVLQLAPPANAVSGLAVTWQSVSGITYYLQGSTNLSASPAFTSIQSNLVGQAGTTTYTDPSATNDGPYFYRVGVQ